MTETALPPLTWIALVSPLVVATVIDLRTRRIPNVLALSALLGGILVQGIAGGWPAIVAAVSGMLTALVLLLPLYMLKGMGAGDVKLMAACGAWLNAPLAATAVALTLLTGMVIAFFLLALRLAAPAPGATAPVATAPEGASPGWRGRLKFPYAAAITVGTSGALLIAHGGSASSSLAWIH